MGTDPTPAPLEGVEEMGDLVIHLLFKENVSPYLACPLRHVVAFYCPG